jgi:hypothetical protein
MGKNRIVEPLVPVFLIFGIKKVSGSRFLNYFQKSLLVLMKNQQSINNLG